MGEAVIADPFRQSIWKSVFDALLKIGVNQRVQRPNQMVHRHARRRFLKDVFGELFASKLRAQVV